MLNQAYRYIIREWHLLAVLFLIWGKLLVMTFIILYSRAEGILEVSLQLLETYIDEKQTPKPLMIYSKYLNSCKCMKF